jgi:hypothetical protein
MSSFFGSRFTSENTTNPTTPISATPIRTTTTTAATPIGKTTSTSVENPNATLYTVLGLGVIAAVSAGAYYYFCYSKKGK